jgi:hypothetical protein
MSVNKDKIERLKKERDDENIVTDLMIQVSELQMQVTDLENRVTELEGGGTA